jgi:hypothetical protein
MSEFLQRLARALPVALPIACLAAIAFTPADAAAQVNMEKITCTSLKLPNCYKLSNGTVEIVVTTDIGPRIARYGFVGGESILGELSGSLAEKDRDTWQAWGGHRLWIAPEGQPKSYGPDNTPIKHAAVGTNGIRLEQPVEKGTGIQKVMTVTMDATGTGVTVRHELINRNPKPYELAVWALTIMSPGGTAIIPQEPYKKHADALLPARPLVLWHYTDLSDSRYAIGPKFIRLSTNEKMPEPQKFGVLNKTGWAAYARNGLLFVKRMKFEEGATYPDYGCSVEVFTQTGFIEVESLGPLRTLKPGEAAEHTERWSLHKDVKVGKSEAEVEAAIGKLTGTGK